MSSYRLELHDHGVWTTNPICRQLSWDIAIVRWEIGARIFLSHRYRMVDEATNVIVRPERRRRPRGPPG